MLSTGMSNVSVSDGFDLDVARIVSTFTPLPLVGYTAPFTVFSTLFSIFAQTPSPAPFTFSREKSISSCEVFPGLNVMYDLRLTPKSTLSPSAIALNAFSLKAKSFIPIPTLTSIFCDSTPSALNSSLVLPRSFPYSTKVVTLPSFLISLMPTNLLLSVSLGKMTSSLTPLPAPSTTAVILTSLDL